MKCALRGGGGIRASNGGSTCHATCADLQVGPFNDRTHKNFAKSQSNFIEYLATPLIEMWAMYLENPELVHRLKVNLEHWTVRCDRPARLHVLQVCCIHAVITEI